MVYYNGGNIFKEHLITWVIGPELGLKTNLKLTPLWSILLLTRWREQWALNLSQRLEIHVNRAGGHKLHEVNISVLLTVIFCFTAANGRALDVKSPGPWGNFYFIVFVQKTGPGLLFESWARALSRLKLFMVRARPDDTFNLLMRGAPHRSCFWVFLKGRRSAEVSGFIKEKKLNVFVL